MFQRFQRFEKPPMMLVTRSFDVKNILHKNSYLIAFQWEPAKRILLILSKTQTVNTLHSCFVKFATITVVNSKPFVQRFSRVFEKN